ncbi:MAG TPA: alkyl/aryl-sulfatase [Candidatus Avilachnospira avistercoris]|nr:alkyl/aryl-sulfatase [Candidatus Avilachnospira avistercoris]
MITKNGKEILAGFDRANYARPSVRRAAENVYFVNALGHSNSTFIIADSSVILIDCLDTVERGEKLRSIIREKTDKPVRTIIYTHIHPDHRGGSGAFKDEVREIIAFKPAKRPLCGMDKLTDIQGLRGKRQFGNELTDEEAVSQGIGPREGVCYGEHREMLAPTEAYDTELVNREIDGVMLELRRLPGETDDTASIWLPDHQVLCCGDNHYGCFPNLYAIRGGQYRDIAAWTESLQVLMDYKAQFLLPGHGDMVEGREAIEERLGNCKEAFSYILNETLEGMNKGLGPEELAMSIKLPEHLSGLPYLQEHYGCVEWTVREIYAAYMGWFDGDPVQLHPMDKNEKCRRLVGLMGGAEKLLAECKNALSEGDAQYCLELSEILENGIESGGQTYAELMTVKAAALLLMADLETSANGRHYYIACAKELMK